MPNSPSQRTAIASTGVHEGARAGAPLTINRRESLAVEVGRKLLAYVLSGAVPPGGRLQSERRLAGQLGVGRTVIREAMKSLELLGLLEVRQGDGTYLRQNHSDVLPHAIEWGLMLGEPRTRELIEARRHLEPILAGLAAERADAIAIADLHSHVRAMRPDVDASRFIEADIAFHLRLARAADNRVLLDMLTSIRSLLHVWISRVIHAETDFEPSYREHQRVLEAVERRDVGAARQAMEDHLTIGSKRLGRTLARYPESHGLGGDSVGSSTRET